MRSKDIALGGFYRRMAACRGGLVASKALARKLAVLFWRVMVKGIDYVAYRLQQHEAKALETQQRSLRRLARQLGQQLIPVPTRCPPDKPAGTCAHRIRSAQLYSGSSRAILLRRLTW